MARICIDEKDLYKKILDKIQEKRDIESTKPDSEREFWYKPNYLIFPHIGLTAQVNYDINKFLKGEKLGGGKSKPLHENRLKQLCDQVGIKYEGIFYMVTIEE